MAKKKVVKKVKPKKQKPAATPTVSLNPLDGKEPLLDEGRELFCLYYTSNHTPHFFRHGQNCYAMVFGQQKTIDHIDEDLQLPSKKRTFRLGGRKLTEDELRSLKRKLLNTARSKASQLLAEPYVRARVDHLFQSLIKNEVIDGRLIQIMLQDEDLSPAVAAARELNSVKGRHKTNKDPSDNPKEPTEVVFRWKDPLPRNKGAVPSATVTKQK